MNLAGYRRERALAVGMTVAGLAVAWGLIWSRAASDPIPGGGAGALAVGACVTLGAIGVLALSLAETARRARREAALRASEGRYRALADMLPQMVWAAGARDGEGTYRNRRYREYYGDLGTDRESRLSRAHPEDKPRMDAACRKAASEGSGYEVEGRLAGADGVHRWHKVVVVPVLEDGEVASWVGTCLDIDDTVTARRAIEEKTALLELAQQAAGAGSWDYDLVSGRVVLSPQSARLHGLPEAESVMDIADWAGLLVPEDAGRTTAEIAGAVDARAQLNIEFRVSLPDGGERWVQGIGRTYYDADGRPLRMIGLNFDVSVRKEAEAALSRAKLDAEAASRAAQEASAAKTEFLAAMSHEVRTPLNAVIGYAGLLAASDRLAPDLRRHAEHARDAGASLLHVVNDILDFSRVEAGRVEVERRPFALASAVDCCLSVARSAAMGRPVEVRQEIDPGLPGWLLGDEGRLRQVLTNLLGNAVKFTPAGSVTLTIRREDGPAGGRCRFLVADTGIGIPADLRDRVFHRFSQVDGSVTRRYGGTGLGLAICKGLVELMAGSIGFDSELGRGSTFWFTLDLPEGAAPAAAPEADVGEVRRARLLLVEDVEINQELARIVLEMAGHSVEVVGEGGAAVEACREGGFDLVLMDVQMPGMDGLEATRRIRALPGPAGRVPVVAMTANVLPAEVATFREAGMDDHVGKPFQREALYAAIARNLPALPEAAE